MFRLNKGGKAKKTQDISKPRHIHHLEVNQIFFLFSAVYFRQLSCVMILLESAVPAFGWDFAPSGS